MFFSYAIFPLSIGTLFILTQLWYWIRKISLKLESSYFSPEKFQINPLSPNTLSTEKEQKQIIFSLAITMITIPIGALAGAIGSLIFTPYSNGKNPIEWFFQNLFSQQALALLTPLMFICVIFELFSLMTLPMILNRIKNNNFIQTAYNSHLLGELNLEESNSEYKIGLHDKICELYQNNVSVNAWRKIQYYTIPIIKCNIQKESIVSGIHFIIFYFILGAMLYMSIFWIHEKESQISLLKYLNPIIFLAYLLIFYYCIYKYYNFTKKLEKKLKVHKLSLQNYNILFTTKRAIELHEIVAQSKIEKCFICKAFSNQS